MRVRFSAMERGLTVHGVVERLAIRDIEQANGELFRGSSRSKRQEFADESRHEVPVVNTIVGSAALCCQRTPDNPLGTSGSPIHDRGVAGAVQS